jgi:trans-2,3-dihydro-3-hydroxyanthranilate isomerase
MTEYRYETVDVFTDTRFGGNPLAVFWDAAGLTTEQMQSLAAEMNYSETTFVLPPDDPANTARVRIFNRTGEMPFAGHPNVGTACVLARLGVATEKAVRFEEISGLVEVRLTGAAHAEIDAPQILQTFETLPSAGIAQCLSVKPDEVDTSTHEPIRASVGVDFVFAELMPGALARALPDLTAYRDLSGRYPAFGGRLSIFLYTRHGADSGIAARMFAPLAGTWEDPATGSANATLAALRLSFTDERELAYRAIQGVEMGRQSDLAVRAWRAQDGIRAAVGGSCVPVFSGKITI